MGLLDKNITITFLEGKVPLEDLFELLKEKLGSKYEVKFLKKGSTAAQLLGTGSANDRIFIAKNALLARRLDWAVDYQNHIRQQPRV